MKYEEYLKTEHWQKRRERAINLAGGHCIVCRNGGAVQVHHNTYAHLWDEQDDDLAVLCDTCHRTFHLPDPPADVPSFVETLVDFWPVILMSDGHYRKGPNAEIAFRS